MDTAQLNNSIGGKSRSGLGAGGEWCTYQLFLSLVRGIALFLTKKHRWANTWNICLILVDNQVTVGHSREHGASGSPCSTSARRGRRCLDSARLRRTAAQPPWCSNPKDFKITGVLGLRSVISGLKGRQNLNWEGSTDIPLSRQRCESKAHLTFLINK